MRKNLCVCIQGAARVSSCLCWSLALSCYFLLGWPVLWVRIVTRLLLLPVIAGLSYELLKWAGRSDNWVVKILSMPGLWLQKITTAEPDDEMLEVAIAAVNAVCDDTPPRKYILGANGREIIPPEVWPEDRYEYPHVWEIGKNEEDQEKEA